ncbi:MAG TPA: DEAD/DEAH box helicase [bacterium]|nr:DEAD/DEAH box helicase [bacterium]
MLKKELRSPEAKLDFSGLGIKDSILKVIFDLGLRVPTPIQHQAIPAALNGEDIVGIAQTGTGKTFAFGIPMLQRLALVKGRGLILLPTRELAGQVENSLRSLGGPLGLRTVSLIGGEAISRQLNALRRRPHILVATPGRLIDHLKRGSVRLDDISVLVLDEADMMFDMGFAPQIEEVLKKITSQHQTLLFSATMPAAVMKLAEKHLRAPVRIEVAPAGTTVELVEQEMLLLPRDSRWEQLLLLLKEFRSSVLIFVRTKHGASKLAKRLQAEKYQAAEIHSNLSFPQRQAALAGFRSGQHRILVATDVAARGLDISGIELVVNFDLPDNSEDYVHRIGRTARAGKKGKAVSFVAPDQIREIQKIERLIRQTLPVRLLGVSAVNKIKVKPISMIEPKSLMDKKFIHQSLHKKKINQNLVPRYDSLGFRKRPDKIDPTATPDYLQPRSSNKKTSFKNNFPALRPLSYSSKGMLKKTTSRVIINDSEVKPKSNNRRFENYEVTPPIVNPSFEGGNRYAFRRAMYLLKEEAKGRSVKKRTSAPINGNRMERRAPNRPLRSGVRASGFKIFKSS